ncbi:MAG: biopolymer transporter ExbD [bacterium]|nr:MAG: biopolymer transporter ExbD [bacterium]
MLNITSMLDMFTILIIFLLKSYSAEGLILTIPADLFLPFSTTQSSPEPGLVVELSRTTMVVDGRVLSVDLAAAEASEALLIPELYDVLMARARQYEEISAVNPDVDFTGRLVLEGDRDIPFSLLKKVLYTCGQAGFINQSLAVFQRE